MTVIEPRQPGLVQRAREFWRYRGLMPFFGKRQLEKRYARTLLGWLWLPLRPLLAVGSQVLVFGSLIGVGSGNTPYLIFFLFGSAAWGLFADTAFWATRSIELNRGIMRRMYIPRLTVLVSSLALPLLEFVMYVLMAAAALVYYGASDGVFYLVAGPDVLIAFAGLGLIVVFGLGIGCWTSVYAPEIRDIRFGLRYLLSFWYLMTPVIYPLEAIPDRYQALAAVNPMAAPVEMVKYGLLHNGEVTLQATLISVSVIAFVCISGVIFFSRSERAALDAL